jgi:hypothetical protein
MFDDEELIALYKYKDVLRSDGALLSVCCLGKRLFFLCEALAEDKWLQSIQPASHLEADSKQDSRIQGHVVIDGLTSTAAPKCGLSRNRP